MDSHATPPIKVQIAYSEKTKSKVKDHRSAEEIQVAYTMGDLHVPCVRLRCLDFSETLYHGLLAAKTATDDAVGSCSPGKRRREDDGDVEEDSPRRGSRRRRPSRNHAELIYK